MKGYFKQTKEKGLQQSFNRLRPKATERSVLVANLFPQVKAKMVRICLGRVKAFFLFL
jgi:hypothetical protein